MHGIGIDYQESAAVLALREASRGRHRTRLIDDGHRTLIPVAAGADGSWGTRAVLSEPGPRPRAAERPGPDPAESARFWQSLHDRLYRFLGQLSPTPRGGYEVAISVPDREGAADSLAVLEHADQAGFIQARAIASTDALLCRWLASSPAAEALPGSVVVVAIGDLATCVAAYERASRATPGPPPTYGRREFIRLPEIGFRPLCDHLLDEVRRRLKESPAPADELLLTDGALEFAARLGRADPDESLDWDGPLHERSFAPFSIAPRDCRNWPAALRLAIEVPAAIRRAAASLGEPTRPALIVLGGLGAVWPIVNEVARDLGPVWRSTAPEQDVALGAAWWSALQVHVGGPDEARAPAAGARRPVPAAVGDALPRPDVGPDADGPSDIPPWLRGGFPPNPA